jgi:hypothetical protein
MMRVLGTMITMTTYGTWLRGDPRGWVRDGVAQRPCPRLEAADAERMPWPPFEFESSALADIGEAIGRSIVERRRMAVLALTVQPRHVHFIVAGDGGDLGALVKCAKDAVRWHLRPDRPIWTRGYDTRFCFDDASLRSRIRYVERHNEAMGWMTRHGRSWERDGNDDPGCIHPRMARGVFTPGQCDAGIVAFVGWDSVAGWGGLGRRNAGQWAGTTDWRHWAG